MVDEVSAFKTEYEFDLPKGYIDKEGNCHKHGIMRLATAADEILPAKDPRVLSNPAYLTIILLSRVITKLGDLEKDQINPKLIENLFVSDLNHLRRLYQKFNIDEDPRIQATCPKCENKFFVDLVNLE
jgi:phage FluMu protein gp41